MTDQAILPEEGIATCAATDLENSVVNGSHMFSQCRKGHGGGRARRDAVVTPLAEQPAAPVCRGGYVAIGQVLPDEFDCVQLISTGRMLALAAKVTRDERRWIGIIAIELASWMVRRLRSVRVP